MRAAVAEQMALLAEQLQLLYERMALDTTSVNDGVAAHTQRTEERIGEILSPTRVVQRMMGQEQIMTIERGQTPAITGLGLADLESSLATFLLHKDYRDYYERHGGSVRVGGFIRRGVDVILDIVVDEKRIVEQLEDRRSG